MDWSTSGMQGYSVSCILVLYWHVTGPAIRTTRGALGTRVPEVSRGCNRLSLRAQANDKHSGWVNHENRTVDLDRNGSRHGTVRAEHGAACADGGAATERRRAPGAGRGRRPGCQARRL